MKRSLQSLILSVFVIFGLLGFTGAMAQDVDSAQVKTKNQYKTQAKMQKQIKKQSESKKSAAKNAQGKNVQKKASEKKQVKSQANNRYRKGNKKGFVDADGDGINDNALDDDGDGIPNGQDEDYVRPEDGTGRQVKSAKGNKKSRGGKQ